MDRGFMVPASREILLHGASAAGLGGRRKAEVEGEIVVSFSGSLEIARILNNRIESHVALACCWSEFVATVHSFS